MVVKCSALPLLAEWRTPSAEGVERRPAWRWGWEMQGSRGCSIGKPTPLSAVVKSRPTCSSLSRVRSGGLLIELGFLWRSTGSKKILCHVGEFT